MGFGAKMSPNFAGHEIQLQTSRLLLRPFEQADFQVALQYYMKDPELREAMEGDRHVPITLDYLERAGEYMARRGFLFAIVERESGRPIGEVCLEWMNLSRAEVRPNERVMRIPVGLWDRNCWGCGYGREVVECLMAYAFDQLSIDRLCAMDVNAGNRRARRLFEACGMRVVRKVSESTSVDLEITQEEYQQRVHTIATQPDKGPSASKQ
jgi:RimJ/RimL family protein N-acetyltransferase